MARSRTSVQETSHVPPVFSCVSKGTQPHIGFPGDVWMPSRCCVMPRSPPLWPVLEGTGTKNATIAAFGRWLER